MTGHPSSPIAAAVGLVATAADGVRRLPQVLDSARRRYDELAEHGREVLAGRGSAPTFDDAAPGPVAVPLTDSPGSWRDAVDEDALITEPPAAPVPPIGRTEPVVLPEDVQDDVAQLTPGADLAHADLPLADFDHLTVPQLRGRIRRLELVELVQLRDYEQAHAHRLPVLTMLDNRVAALLADTSQ
ncbi:MAG TPA: hypothetical protein VLM05_14710 [Mycobacteriales bacterium]|nr:hypothetical protein [Mycobacteriales bacterium]